MLNFKPKPVSNTRHHNEWLSLIEISGPFLSIPVLNRVFPQGLPPADVQTVARLKSAYEEWDINRESQRSDPAIHRAWLRYVLQEGLGLDEESWREGQSLPPGLEARLEMHGETLRPTGAVVDPSSGKPRLLVQFWDAGQNLHKPVTNLPWKSPPDSRMAELLRATDVPLGLVSNGEQWLLVWAPRGETAGYVTWLASLWFEERVTWRAFAALLGVERFFGVADAETLETLLSDSVADQQEVTDRLGYQVRRAVEVLVTTFDRENRARGGALLAGVAESKIYEAALTVMMRLVFLFCAEERGLLLRGDPLYDQHYAVSTLRAQLREAADRDGEEVLEYRKDAWSRLLATFRAVYGGVEHDQMPLPAYGGNLFDPDRFPFLEGRAADSSWRDVPAAPLPIDNRTVLHLLSALQELEVKSGGERETRLLSFRALDIEQIGHVYEGLLDHTVKRAAGPVLSLFGTKFDEPEVELETLEELRAKGGDAQAKYLGEQTGRSAQAIRKALELAPGLEESEKLRLASGGDAALHARLLPFHALIRPDSFGRPVVIAQGSLFVTQGSDRRSSGTHYTPRSLTEPLVARTLDPLLYEGMAEGVAPSPETLKAPREILALKICDPACGSAGVLVQACRYLAERLIEAWAKVEAEHPGVAIVSPEGALATGAPEEQALPVEPEERLALARRVVAARCLYGVDKDPLAVEMAKLSLWLITLEKQKPFTFLDHAIRCGDSLLGVDALQLRNWSLDRAASPLFQVPIQNAVREAIRLRRELEQMPDDGIVQVRDKERLLHAAEAATARALIAGDLIIASAFANGTATMRQQWLQRKNAQFVALPTPETEAELGEEAAALLPAAKPFHWPLEFPEVFFDDENGVCGFDAMVGNPPFSGGKKITGNLGVPYRNYVVESLARKKTGSADLVAYFYLRAFGLLRLGGSFGLIATNTIAQGDTREVGLDQITQDSGTIYAANPSQKWPGTANLEVAVVHVRKGAWEAACDLAGQSVPAITSFLTPPGAISGNPHRLAANAGKSFIGSVLIGSGFVLTPEEVSNLIKNNPRNADVLQLYLNGEDLNSRPDHSPSRWVINFKNWPLNQESAPDSYVGPVAADYPDCLAIVEALVKPHRDNVNRDAYRLRWWQFAERCANLYEAITGFSRVLVTARVSPTQAFVLMEPGLVFQEKVVVFPLPQIAFSITQSSVHYIWSRHYSSTLGGVQTLNYSPSDCFETFPFPQPTAEQERVLESLGAAYHEARRQICLARQLGLTKVYNLFHDPGTQSDAPVQKQSGPFDDIRHLRDLHRQMDEAVAVAYGWHDLDLGHGFHETAQGIRYTVSDAARRELLDRLLALNHTRYAAEVAAGLHEKIKGGGGKTRIKSTSKGTKPKKAANSEQGTLL